MDKIRLTGPPRIYVESLGEEDSRLALAPVAANPVFLAPDFPKLTVGILGVGRQGSAEMVRFVQKHP